VDTETLQLSLSTTAINAPVADPLLTNSLQVSTNLLQKASAVLEEVSASVTNKITFDSKKGRFEARARLNNI
jgi:hypothetical protein